MPVVVTVTGSDALAPVAPVMVNVHVPAATGVTVSVPVVVVGAVAIVTRPDTHVEMV
jgi:Sec-independent protein secretion pathway component TatC